MKTNVLLFMIILIGTQIQSQTLSPTVIASAGSHFENNGIRMDLTIGEVVVETHQGNQHVLSQGFNQVFEVPDSPLATNARSSEFEFEVFPNPTSNILFIRTETPEPFKVMLTDVSGKTLVLKDFESFGKIELSHLPDNSYWLSIFDEKGLIQTYQISKIKG